MTPERSDNASALPRSSVINSAAYCNGVRVAVVPIPDLGDAWRHSDRFFWVGLYEPSEPLLAHIQQAFGLHDLAIEDAHRAHQRPKLEVYDDSMFVVLRTARLCEEGEHRIEFGETHVFVGPRYVVTVRHGSLKSHVGLRARCEASPQLLAKGEGFVLHALMDFIVDQYFPILDALQTELDELEEQIFSGTFVQERHGPALSLAAGFAGAEASRDAADRRFGPTFPEHIGADSAGHAAVFPGRA